MRIVLCASMSAARKLLEVKEALSSMDHEVIVPANIAEHAAEQKVEMIAEKESLDVFRAYFQKIRESDAVLVVNEMKNGVPNYIGPNSLIEMAFAYVLGKKIYLLHGIPDGYAHDEIAAMHPIMLHGNLSALHDA